MTKYLIIIASVLLNQTNFTALYPCMGTFAKIAHSNLGQCAIEIEIDRFISPSDRENRLNDLRNSLASYSDTFKKKILSNKNYAFVSYTANKYIDAIKKKDQWVIDLIEILLDFGCDPNDFSNNQTALHIAAEVNNTQLAGLIIRHRGDLNVTKKVTMLTPLHVACAFGNLEIFKLLINFRADTNTQDALGANPLHYVAGRPWGNVMHFDLSKFFFLPRGSYSESELEDYGKQIKARTYMIGVLLNSCSAKEPKDIQGSTPIELAKLYGHQALVQVFENASANSSSSGQVVEEEEFTD